MAGVGKMLLLIAGFAGLGGFLYGYDLGLIGGALLNIKEDFATSDADDAWIVGAAKAGAFFGTFLGGASMYKYGRRGSIAYDSIFFVIGPLLMAVAQSIGVLIVGRAVIGLGIGVSAVVVPAYLGEMAPSAVRGAVVVIYECMLCVGMLAAAVVDAILEVCFSIQDVPNNWRWMVGIPIVPGLLMAAALLLLPESPRWLLMRNDCDGALRVLHQLNHSQALGSDMNTTPEVEDEFLMLWNAVEQDHAAFQERRAAQSAASSTPRDRHLLDGAGGAETAGTAPSLTKSNSPFAPHDDNRTENPLLCASEAVPSSSHIASPLADQVAASTIKADARQATLDSDKALIVAEQRYSSRFSLSSQDAAFEIVDLRQHAPFDRDGSLEIEQDDDPLRAHPLVPPAQKQFLKSLLSLIHAPHALSTGRQPTLESTRASLKQRYDMHEPFLVVLARMIVDISLVLRGPEKRAVLIALCLAFFNQIGASTSIINYAPEVLELVGVEQHKQAIYYSSFIGAGKTVGVIIGLLLVDRLGRRPLLIGGGIGCGVAMFCLSAAIWADSVVVTTLSMCLYILSFSMSWAGVFWVLCSELFSMSIKSAAMSAATACLFASGALADVLFPIMLNGLNAGAFMVFGVVTLAGSLYTYICVPETKGLSLLQIQAALQGDT